MEDGGWNKLVNQPPPLWYTPRNSQAFFFGKATGFLKTEMIRPAIFRGVRGPGGLVDLPNLHCLASILVFVGVNKGETMGKKTCGFGFGSFNCGETHWIELIL